MRVPERARYVLLLAAAMLAGAGQAAAQGSFDAVGPMQSARALHTAITLNDGSVLVAGGEDHRNFFESLSSAEIYDPVTNTFSLVPSAMQTGRSQHTATLLASGKVLLAGGANQACCRYNGNYGDRPNATADIYDPVTRTFSATANRMSVDRYEHAATRLADGRVLITGGVTDINYTNFSNGADIYDPATNSFTPTGNMTVARYTHASVLLPDGKVLIVGGSQTSASAELYDPATGTFTPTANPPALATRTPRAFALADGSVIVFGHDRLVQKYDPATQTFTAMPSTVHTHVFWAAVVALSDGRILLADDFKSELYDPSTGSTVDTGNPGVGDLYPVAAALADGRALLTGGENFVPYTFVSQTLASVFTPNAPPVAVAGPNRQVSPGDGCVAPVTLDGSGSSDPDGDMLTYTWSRGEEALGTGVTLPVTLGPGTHVITLSVDDGRGGVSSATTTIVVADTVAPTFTVPAPVTLEQSGPAGTSFVPTLPSAFDNCTVSPDVTIAGAPENGVFPAGTTSLTYTAKDDAGNEFSDVTTVTVRDTIAPALNVPASVSAEATSALGAVVTFATSATDAVTLTPTVSCTPASGATFPLGHTSVTCAVADAVGNRAERTFVVTVSDTTAPTLIVPPAVLAEATSPAGAVVSYVASATDLVTALPVVTCAPASGTMFPVGATSVACTARDASGNVATASFAVTVRDTVAPAIVEVTPSLRTLWPVNHKMSAVTLAVTATDATTAAPACTVTGVSSSEPANGFGDNTAPDWVITGPLAVQLRAERLGKGAGRVYTLQVRCTDGSGNTSTATTTVAVPHDRGK